jgi:hypothetical protein
MKAAVVPANLRPLSIEAWLVSTRVTETPDFCAATRAIPNPYAFVSCGEGKDEGVALPSAQHR